MAEATKSGSATSAAVLVVIDVQNDFCHESGRVASLGGDVTAIQSMLPTLLDTIAAAKAAGMSVFYVRAEHGDDSNSYAWNGRKRGHERGESQTVSPCAPGSWGAEFYRVDPQHDDVVIVKHRYSGFVNTDLDAELRSREISSLFFAGVTTEICVESTVRDALCLDYEVTVLSDCCATGTTQAHEQSLDTIRSYYGAVIDSPEFMKLIEM